MPGKTELLLLGIIFLLYLLTFFIAKKKNFSLFWSFLFVTFFGPFWWFVMFLRKSKKLENSTTMD